MTNEAHPRYLYRITNVNADEEFVFPLNMFEWDERQPMDVPITPVVGHNYGYYEPQEEGGLVQPADNTVRFTLIEDLAADIDDMLDDLRAKSRRWGALKIWTKGADDTLRWARATLSERPQAVITPDTVQVLPVNTGLKRFTEWFAEDEVVDIHTVIASGATFTVNNPGHLPVDSMVITLLSVSSAGFVNPVIDNLTNGYSFASLRDAAAINAMLRLNTDEPSVEFNAGSGSTSGDLANYVFPTAQHVLSFRLEPGDNTIRYTGAGSPNLTIQFAFWPVMA